MIKLRGLPGRLVNPCKIEKTRVLLKLSILQKSKKRTKTLKIIKSTNRSFFSPNLPPLFGLPSGSGKYWSIIFDVISGHTIEAVFLSSAHLSAVRIGLVRHWEKMSAGISFLIGRNSEGEHAAKWKFRFSPLSSFFSLKTSIMRPFHDLLILKISNEIKC